MDSREKWPIMFFALISSNPNFTFSLGIVNTVDAAANVITLIDNNKQKENIKFKKNFWLAGCKNAERSMENL